MDLDDRRAAAWLTSTEELAGLAHRLDLAPYEDFAARFDVLGPDTPGFFTGQGRSGYVARMAAMRFMHMDLPAHVVGEATAPSIGEGDVLTVISGSGRTPVSLNFAQVAQGTGASVLLITHQTGSPLRDLADASLVLPIETSQFGGTLFEEGALILLDSIVADQMRRRGVPHEVMARRHTNFL